MKSNVSILGLNNYEIRAYESLVRLGKSTATKISKMSGVPHGKVYTVLDSLAKKGLIDEIPKEPREFIPNNPELLIDFVDKRNRELTELRNEIEQLKRLYKEDREIDESKILVRQGKKAFYNIISNLLGANKYDYSIRWNYEYHKDWAKTERKSIQKGIDLKVLTRYDNETRKSIKKWLGIHKNIRAIENEGVVLDIQDDKEVLITIIGCNATILIRDVAFAKLMKQMFLHSYNLSKRIA
jgi:sugar-specific transcriptional regulator TrmB